MQSLREKRERKLIHGKICVKQGNEKIFIPKKNIIMFVKNGRKTDLFTVDDKIYPNISRFYALKQKSNESRTPDGIRKLEKAYLENRKELEKLGNTNNEYILVKDVGIQNQLKKLEKNRK